MQALSHEASEARIQAQLLEAQAQAAEFRDLSAAQQAGVEEARAQLAECEARTAVLLEEVEREREASGAAAKEVRGEDLGLVRRRRTMLCGSV
jgi:hypothetical protein